MKFEHKLYNASMSMSANFYDNTYSICNTIKRILLMTELNRTGGSKYNKTLIIFLNNKHVIVTLVWPLIESN